MSATTSSAQTSANSLAGAAGRIVLVTPTKFLGNLLLSGGLIQQLCQWCLVHNKPLLLVLDESFAGLTENAFPGAEVVFYPRRALRPGSPRLAGIRAWWRCVASIREFAADLAFTIEEDSVCHRLTHLSGAKYKVSSTANRYHFGFDLVLDIARSGRPESESSIWFSVRDVFQALGIPVEGGPAYLRLTPDPAAAGLFKRLPQLATMANKPLLLIHAGASKPYKQWPSRHFAQIACLAIESGYLPCLIGAGHPDQQINTEVLARIKALGVDPKLCLNLCDQLSLAELASLMTISSKMLGNDSGPSHLASALGLPGVVIFGPTDLGIWRPLAATTTVLEKKSECSPACSRHHCSLAYRCLSEIRPSEVAEHLAFQA